MIEPAQYLLDTNIVSESLKKRGDAGVISFLQSRDPSALFLSVLTLGELRKGITSKGKTDAAGAARLAGWVDGLEYSFGDRIIAIDIAAARLWGEWSAPRSRPTIDTLFAATAASRDLILVTRNIRDVQDLPVRTLNPWSG